MKRFPRALAVGALLLAATTACGGSGGDAGDDPTGSASASPSESESGSESGSSGGGADAGACTGETQEVQGAEGVVLTVPAEWTVEDLGRGDIRLTSADGDSVEGQLFVEQDSRGIDQGVADVERLNSQSEKTSEQEIELPGFDDARELQFSGSNTGSTGSFVVAVGGGVRAIAYAIVEDDATDQASVAFGCMLTLQR